MQTLTDLSENQRHEIKAALEAHMPLPVEIDWDHAEKRSQAYYLPILPAVYPEDRYGFFEGIAETEIDLFDRGIRVHFVPGFRQRMLVIARLGDRSQIAYLSEDGTEYQDLARLLNTSVESLMPMAFQAYPYDSKQDLDYVLSQARTDHPKADYSNLE